MEEEKAAAYYDELTRKGVGAARFKQGLGYPSYSVENNPPFSKSSSSFFSTFVKASQTEPSSEIQKRTQIQNVQGKLQKKPPNLSEAISNTKERSSEHRTRDCSRSGHRDERNLMHRNRSCSRDRARFPRRRKRRSKSPCSSSEEEGRRWHGRDRSERSHSPIYSRRRDRRRSRSASPRGRRFEKRGEEEGKGHRPDNERKNSGISYKGCSKDKKFSVDYSRLIEGYADMMPVERVKAKMKLQLSQTVANETVMGAGWERFDFDKDAPLDEEEIEAADDDAALVKNMGQSFQYSAVKAKQEEEIKVAHDQAMFGSATASSVVTEKKYNKGTHDQATFGTVAASAVATEKYINDYNSENDTKASTEATGNLMSDKVLAIQQGSWRERARKMT